MTNLFNALGGNQQTTPQNIIQQYKQFRQSLKGNPMDIINQKLQSGEITQQQIEQAKAMMNQFKGLLG